MISNIHYIELYVNKQYIELQNQESLNLRFNNVLFDPTKVSTTQASYSFSFEIPATPNNNRVFDYANNLSKVNKFHARYDAQVYADGEMIFNGSLTIRKYSAIDKVYTCNLVNIKTNSLEDIFGDDTLTTLHWDVDFDGADTINNINYDTDTKYYFPLVSYGVFQKDYITTDSVGNTYSAKNRIDKYNKWWIESFYPSLNVVETMRKAFENKGYTVGGSAFSDPNFRQLYASCNLASEQTPIYNIGNPKLGSVAINLTWNNYQSYNETAQNPDQQHHTQGVTISNSTGGFVQDLKFPYQKIEAVTEHMVNTQYNFDTVMLWNMMDTTNNPSGVTVNLNQDSYIYDPNEHLIVIPADGWYRINLNVSADLSGNTAYVEQWYNTFYNREDLKREWIQINGSNASFKEYYPIEIQLVRNYDENVELIKGKKNKIYYNGNPNDSEYRYKGEAYTAMTYNNIKEWETEFPHQNPYGSDLPTKDNGLLDAINRDSDYELLKQYLPDENVVQSGGNSTNGGRNYGGTRGNSTSGGLRGGSRYNTIGFMTKQGKIQPYDPAVSTAFICGFSTMSDGVVSVMKNGRSWNPAITTNNMILANVDGLTLYNNNVSTSSITQTETDYCKNEYRYAPSGYINVTDTHMEGTVSCLVYLNRNDVLELMAVQRDFEGQVYSTSASCHIDITAISDRTESELRGDNNFSFYSNSEFPQKLNLFNFTNNETKVTDWISNIQKAFNLVITNNGTDIQIDTNKGVNKNIQYAVNVDDRVGHDEHDTEYIAYAKEMAVKYKIDTNEYGYELTVPHEYINEEDWAKYGDSGYTVINLSDDSYETGNTTVQTNFSYTYYMDFDYYQMLSGGTVEENTPRHVRIPVIEDSTYMAEGYSYDESMKHDGYSKTQRFWYRDQMSPEYVYLSSIKANGQHETIDLTYPMNTWMGFNLSYKDTEKSIATEYFNIYPLLSSNYVNIKCYLTPSEYNNIKNGAMIIYDSDKYYVSEISGYDPSGTNKTKLKLIKKI